MARGWESKSIEDQIDAADRRKSEAAPRRPTPEEIERESLMLQRKRVLEVIERSQNPRYVEQQRKALAYLEGKLRELAP
ncbi:MAG: hypothetical protein ACR2I2_10610 [Bryobacteraceae bacterium]